MLSGTKSLITWEGIPVIEVIEGYLVGNSVESIALPSALKMGAPEAPLTIIEILAML